MPTHPEALIRVDDISHAYSHELVLDSVTLEVQASDFLGIVGPSGSGKTTLLRALSGSVEPLSGRVTRAPGIRFGFVPQLEQVNWNFPVTVAECILMARTRPIRRFWSSRSERQAERRELDAVLDRLGLGGLGDRHIRALSGGQQQRMFLARALMTDADVLLLDEPTSGLDVQTRHEVLHLLDELRNDGLAIVVTTHDLNGIAAHLPSVMCLNVRVIGSGTPQCVLTPEILEETYGSPMEVLQHAGMPVVIDARRPMDGPVGPAIQLPDIDPRDLTVGRR